MPSSFHTPAPSLQSTAPQPAPSSAHPSLLHGLAHLLRATHLPLPSSSSLSPHPPRSLTPTAPNTASGSLPAHSGFSAPHSAEAVADEAGGAELRSASQPLNPPQSSSSSPSAVQASLLRASLSSSSLSNHARGSAASHLQQHEPSALSGPLSAFLSASPLASLYQHLQRLSGLEAQHRAALSALDEATQKRRALTQSVASPRVHSPDTPTAERSSPIKPLPAPASMDHSPLRPALHPHSARLRGASLERLSRRPLPFDLSSASPAPPPPPADPLLSQSVRQFLCHVREAGGGGSSHALPLHAHTFRFKTYPQCFTGQALVDWMIGEGWANDRREAVAMAGVVHEEGGMVGLGGAGGFEDGAAVYRWKAERAGGGHAGDAPWRWDADVMEYGLLVNTWKEGRETLEAVEAASTRSDERERALRVMRQSLLHLCIAAKHWRQTRETAGYSRYVLEKRIRPPASPRRPPPPRSPLPRPPPTSTPRV